MGGWTDRESATEIKGLANGQTDCQTKKTQIRLTDRLINCEINGTICFLDSLSFLQV